MTTFPVHAKKAHHIYPISLKSAEIKRFPSVWSSSLADSQSIQLHPGENNVHIVRFHPFTSFTLPSLPCLAPLEIPFISPRTTYARSMNKRRSLLIRPGNSLTWSKDDRTWGQRKNAYPAVFSKLLSHRWQSYISVQPTLKATSLRDSAFQNNRPVSKISLLPR